MARKKREEGGAPAPAPSPAVAPAVEAPRPAEGIRQVLTLPLTLTVVVADKPMHLEDVLKIKQGDVIEFEKVVTSPLTVEVHGHAIAHGHAVKLGEKFGLKIGSILPPEETARVLGRPPG